MIRIIIMLQLWAMLIALAKIIALLQ